MAEPSDPRKPTPELHEVERALSVLQGRHPEHERARREDEEARRRREAEHDSEAAREARRVRARRATYIGLAAPIVLLFVFIAVFGSREMARRARIDAVSESYRQYGFQPIETSLRGSTGALEVSAEAGCFLAVSTGTKPIEITRAGLRRMAAPPALFCTCTAERIGLSSPVGGQGGLALLRADTAAIGGSDAFAFLGFPLGSTLPVDEPCRAVAVDAWVEARRQPQHPVTDAWLATPSHAALRDAGFHVVAVGAPGEPLVVADAPKDSCVLVLSPAKEQVLSMRAKGEALPLAGGAPTLARCAQSAATLIVSRVASAGEVTVLAAPAARVGGLLGLRDAARASGIAPVLASMAAADRPWDAQQALVASAIPESIVKTFASTDVTPDAEARVVALSLDAAGLLYPDPPESTQRVASCSPALDQAPLETLCVLGGTPKWRTSATAEGGAFGLARANLPFWLYSMQGVKEPAALLGLAKLFGLARVLARQGFVPTTLEALVEKPNGVEVLGRTGEDAVVAVGVAPVEPWVYPLSEDAPWELEGVPQIAMVKPLAKVTLVTSLKRLPPIPRRRTVVFRRQAKVAP
ncbi:MAG: hypothetical protein JWP97_2485 [Labilithrix sp.]|nr:hypothetical protein [Labilithrix sp.]